MKTYHAGGKEVTQEEYDRIVEINRLWASIDHLKRHLKGLFYIVVTFGAIELFHLLWSVK